ncbi:hypothetical protein ACQ1R0_03825 [Ornithobacterium rhinotracheale]
MNTEKLQKLQAQVIDWATERGIFEKSDAYMQLLKTGEEVLELLGAIHQNNKSEIIDALGDIQVCLINYLHFKVCDKELVNIYDEEQITARLEDIYLMNILGSIMEIELLTPRAFPRNAVSQFIGILKKTATAKNLTLVDCLESAYNVIKNRTGKMINGQFVKEK